MKNFKKYFHEYTEREATTRGQKIKDAAAALVKKYGRGAVKHATDVAVKAEVQRKLNELIPQKHRV